MLDSATGAETLFQKRKKIQNGFGGFFYSYHSSLLYHNSRNSQNIQIIFDF
jgi:hypothetical protein